jgi:O-antigen/teichoic acid export membrane protein
VLLRHVLLYLAARGIPGVLNFLAIALYTRLLDPAVYGQYTLVLTGVGLAAATIFQWLRLGLLRFLPEAGPARAEFLHTVSVLFRSVAAGSALLAGLAFLLLPYRELTGLLALALGLLWLQGWFELNLELVRTQLTPLRYGLFAVMKAGLSLAFAVTFISFGWGVPGILLGLGLGMIIPYVTLGAWRAWRVAAGNTFNRELAARLLRYGLPLTATFALGFVVNSSDRFLLAALSGTEAAGLYAAGYDLGQYTIGVIMMIINLAAYPLIIRAMEQQGPDAARQQMRSSARLLLAVGVPATAGLALLAPGIAAVIVGPEFRAAAAVIIPLIALAALIAGFKAYHVDVGVQLGRRTGQQAWVMLLAALLNIGLNLWWIPLAGILGAVYATITAYLVALVASWLLVRGTFPVPAPPADSWRVFVATLLMVLMLQLFPAAESLLLLGLQAAAGGLAYGVALLALMPVQARIWLARRNTDV